MLTTHLSAILRENHSVVQDSIQVVVDQALEQHHQAAKVINSQFPFPTPSKKKIARIHGRRGLRPLPSVMPLPLVLSLG